MSRTIPGPAGLPLLGSFLQVAGDRLAFLRSLRERYGHTVAFRVGATRFVFINRPDDVRHVLDEGSRCYAKGVGLQQARTALGDGMLTSDAATAAERRLLFAPFFQRSSIDALTPAIERITTAHLDRCNVAEPVELMTSMAELTMNIALTVLFGMDGEVDARRLAALFTRMEKRALRRMLFDLVRPPRGHSRHRDEIERAIAPLRARDGPLQRAVQSLPNEAAIDELVTMLFASHETTATALTWTLILLAEHRAEREAIDAEPRRLTHAIEESLRLYPPVWLLPRVAIEEDARGDYRIEAGTHVIISPYVLHRDPDWWTDSDAFTPSRFERPFRPGTYIPFGTGARSCIGARLAMLELNIVLAAIVKRFLLTPARRCRVRPMPMLSLRAQPRVLMRLTKTD
ncbi:MAG TPA: cytochrome P450 [Thermoanaerobaculia bacterium]|nr:cytochrome P450 [Thermoanaerobaculia bacterium]